jgi:hypothetical protein
VAAHLAGACLRSGHTPCALQADPGARQALMDDLDRSGVPRRWEPAWLAGLHVYGAPDPQAPAPSVPS